jgi:hypothetical protein
MRSTLHPEIAQRFWWSHIAWLDRCHSKGPITMITPHFQPQRDVALALHFLPILPKLLLFARVPDRLWCLCSAGSGLVFLVWVIFLSLSFFRVSAHGL